MNSVDNAYLADAVTISGNDVLLRRLLGSYYTPDKIAEVLVRWALCNKPGRLLDPSFGGCAFLEAGAKVLCELTTERSGERVFGVDIDSSCAKYVRNSALLREANCTFQDFLLLTPDALKGAPFQAIVGNPPYVRHHWVKDKKRVAARRIAEKCSIDIPKSASLWAYFVVHALAFLAPGGRMALLVPEAILQADYASPIRDLLATSFGKVRLIHVRERLFDGTDESVVVIAGENFGTAGTLEVLSVDSAGELEIILHGLDIPRPQKTLENGRRVLPAALDAMAQVEGSGRLISFQTLATARIGIVTGANNHFIRSDEELCELGVPEKARPAIVARTKWLSGLDFTLEDHRSVAECGARAYLVRPTPLLDTEPGVLRWIREGEKAKINERHKCKERYPWYRVDLPQRPDAFVTAIRMAPPLLVINRTAFRCTNTLYAVNFNSPDGVNQEAIALGFLTSFVALWAELNGRRYGGGVLKLDLKTLGQLPLPVVETASTVFDEANKALREGDEEMARDIANDAVLRQGLGVSQAAISCMNGALEDLSRQRIPRAKKS